MLKTKTHFLDNLAPLGVSVQMGGKKVSIPQKEDRQKEKKATKL
jgi:hypothetical protein